MISKQKIDDYIRSVFSMEMLDEATFDFIFQVIDILCPDPEWDKMSGPDRSSALSAGIVRLQGYNELECKNKDSKARGKQRDDIALNHVLFNDRVRVYCKTPQMKVPKHSLS